MNFLGLYGPPNPYVLILSSFVISLILAPYSPGFLYFILFLIGYEIFYAIVMGIKAPYWSWDIRLGVVVASFLGFMMGKLLANDKEPFKLIKKKRELTEVEKAILKLRD